MNKKLYQALKYLVDLKVKAVSDDTEPKSVDVTNLDIFFDVYKQSGKYEVGDIRRNPETDQPFKCILAYDADVQPDWNLDVATLWIPYHGTDEDHAYPFKAPNGAHDMYKQGEYMTFIDVVYKAKMDTTYSPEEYPDAWEIVE